MVRLSSVLLLALSSLTVAQRGGNWDQWRDLCNKPEYKDYCSQWIEWVRGGQQGRPPQGAPSSTIPRITPKSTTKSSTSPKAATQPKYTSSTRPSSTVITPQTPPWQSQSQQPPWQPPSQSTQPIWQPQPTQNQPPNTPAPQQGPAPATAICTVEIYSFTTRPEGQRTRTRTRTIIVPTVSTITSLITTDTTSIAVETIIQEQREQTITSSQTICN